MTANEVEFSLRVEEMLSSIKRPEFRQSIVEVTQCTSGLLPVKLSVFEYSFIGRSRLIFDSKSRINSML